MGDFYPLQAKDTEHCPRLWTSVFIYISGPQRALPAHAARAGWGGRAEIQDKVRGPFSADARSRHFAPRVCAIAILPTTSATDLRPPAVAAAHHLTSPI